MAQTMNIQGAGPSLLAEMHFNIIWPQFIMTMAVVVGVVGYLVWRAVKK
ncbi:MAG TPA: hypothetical protein VME18_03490 [Acidobacteriaceae bacterium]|nr:hypothetical protein [Acidobacteriaceae bacterium]